MVGMQIVGAVLACALFLYLGCALLWPERFE
jgi:K+-transporting ATPase KdpF subunit